MAGGTSWGEAGAIYDVAPRAAGNWYRRYQRTNSLSPLAMGGDLRWKLGDEVGLLSERLAGTCDVTLTDVRRDLAARGVVVGIAPRGQAECAARRYRAVRLGGLLRGA